MPPQQILAVDLRTLYGDLRAEAAWAAVSRNWRAAPALLGAQGASLAALAAFDVTSLPIRPEIVARLAAWQAGGGRSALVSDDPALAARVAAHLGLFDEVVARADARPDGWTWLETAPPAGTGRALLRALRPHQWAKNLLVFLPMLAAHRLDGATALLSLVAFVAFCLVASSVYLLNDLLDLAADRAHPRKRLRPFASGALPLAWGRWLAPGFLAAGLVVGALAGPLFVAVLVLYYAATLAYSLNLKRRLVIDICMLAGLYTLRIVAGGAATAIPLSMWLLAFATFFFFSLAAVKRQGELVDRAAESQTGAAGRGYITADLPIVAGMALASGYVAILVMALFINATAETGLYATPEILWGICPVLFYWISRIVMITHRGWMHDDPVVYAFRDNISRICFVAILASAVGATVFRL